VISDMEETTCQPITTRLTISPPNGSALSLQGDLFPSATWTSAASSMSNPAISPATTSATFSPGSAAGLTHSRLPAGAAPSGPAPVPVSRFRAQDSAKAMPINDTSGPLFTASSPSAALQLSLESRLRAQLGVNGSPEYALIWRQQDMPSGPPICALRASARRTSGRDYSGWPSPSEGDRGRLAIRTYGRGWGNFALDGAAQLAGWPTPNAMPPNRGGLQSDPVKALERRRQGHMLNLDDAATLAGWVTPTAHDVSGRSQNQKAKHGTKHGCAELANQVPGVVPSGSPASTEKRGALNPAFSRWLMGYPPEWDDCAATAMPSSRRSRQSS
jgi:hypothetical protein